jgi:hypothetical protein
VNPAELVTDTHAQESNKSVEQTTQLGPTC